jgi:hypothetical protein
MGKMPVATGNSVCVTATQNVAIQISFQQGKVCPNVRQISIILQSRSWERD